MPTELIPLWFEWNGNAMVPLNHRAATRQFVVHDKYRLERREERSTQAHAHQFAWLHEAWLNLPEKLADLYPSAEHLRKRALIDAGYYDEMIVDAGSHAAAVRVAGAFRSIDDFAVVIVRGPLVVRRTAKSQSRRAMNKAEFQASKTALMETVASLIGTTTAALRHEAA